MLLILKAVYFQSGMERHSELRLHVLTLKTFQLSNSKGVFEKNERGQRLNAIKSAFDRY